MESQQRNTLAAMNEDEKEKKTDQNLKLKKEMTPFPLSMSE